MAKTEGLNSAINKLRKNYKRVLNGAVKYATEEAKKDIYNHALTCLEEYYDNYLPTSYERSESLIYSFLPYTNIRQSNDCIISIVGIEYNAGLLGSYADISYSASKKYGTVNYEWVIDNYLDGIHPVTNGYPKKKGTNEVVYYEITDSKSPTEKMEEYLTEYAKKYAENVYSYLAAYIMK